MSRHARTGSVARALRRTAAILVTSVLAVGAVLVTVAPASAATNSLLQDDFKSSTVQSLDYTLSPASQNFTPCLTVAGSPTTQSPASCIPSTTDTARNGALRITDSQGYEAGYVLYNHALPTRGGLDISFTQYQYGGSGADGIAFFLTDGRYALTQVGANGGALGYNAKSATGAKGLPHALVGIGLDAWGNFPVEYNSAECAAQTGVTKPTSRTTNVIAIRGPAADVADNAGTNTGYCLLAAPTAPLTIHDAGSTRPAGHAVRIVVDSPQVTANPMVTVYYDGVQALQVAEPDALKTASTFKFGWTASTGGSNDIHEVSNLVVNTKETIAPSISAAAAGSIPAVAAGTAQNVTVKVSTGSADGPEAQPVTATVTLPSGTGSSFAGTPTGTGWSCPAVATGALTRDCTWTPSASSPVVPGSTLPDLVVPVTSTRSGTRTVTVSATSSDNSTSPVSSTTANVGFTPVANAGTGTGTASATPSAISITATAAQTTGTPTYQISTAPSTGTVTINAATGAMTYTPAAHASGVFTYQYTVTADGATSAPATVTVTVNPTASDASVTTAVNTGTTIDLSTLVEGSGFTYSTSALTGQGSISRTGSVVTFTPATDKSGVSSFTYTATDGASHTTASHTVTITTTPTTGDTSGAGALSQSGAATVTSSAPAGHGSGLTYTKTGGPEQGTASINATTGVVTYTAANGVSGVFHVTFTASDGTSVTSSHTSTITVRPYVADVSTATTVGAAQFSTPAPSYTGKTPTWTVVTPAADGTTGAVSSTGRVAYTPSATASGTQTIVLRATDADGAYSDVTVHIDVLPTAAAVGTGVTASTSSATGTVAPSGAGSSLTYSIVAGSASTGLTASVNGSGQLSLTAAAGVSGTLTAKYIATDTASGLQSAPAVVTLTVTPTTTDVAASGTLDGTGSALVASPAPTGVGSNLQYQLVDDLGGRATIDAATGKVTLSITDGKAGVYTPTYKAVGAGSIGTTTHTATFTITPYAVAPDATPAVVNGPAVTSGSPAGTGADAAQTWAFVGPHAGATIDAATGAVTYTPGTASGDITFTVRATDNGQQSDPVSVTFAVAPSAAPVAGSTTAATPGTAVTIAGAGTGSNLVTSIVAGTVDSRLASATASGSDLVLTPQDGASGIMAAKYQVRDTTTGLTSTAKVTLTVTPVAQPATVEVQGGGTALEQLPGVGSGLHYEIVTGLPAAQGTATLSDDGLLTVKPTAGTSGTESVTYHVVDADGQTSGTATVEIDVKPVATAASSTASSTTSATFDLTQRGSGTGPLTYTYTAPTAAQGTVVRTGDTLTFTPAAGTAGDVVIPFTVTDPSGLAASSTLTVHVGPALGNVSASVRLSASGHADVATPAPTTDAVAPKFAITTAPAVGTAEIDQSTGVVTYHAAQGRSGEYTVGYTVTDGQQHSSVERTATIDVSPSAAGTVSDAVVDGPEIQTTAPAVQGDGPFTWSLVSGPAAGTVASVDSTGRVSYVPSATDSGIQHVTLSAKDAHGLSTGDVVITIDVAPAVAAVSGNATASAAPTGTTIAAAGTGTQLSYTLGATSAGVGSAAMDAAGTGIVITPVAGASGKLTVSYTATDGSNLTSAPATATLVVAPVAGSTSASVASGSSLSTTVPTPVGTGPWTYAVTGMPSADGTVSIAADGTLSVSAVAGRSGRHVLGYTATGKDDVSSSSATLIVDVVPAVSGADATIATGESTTFDLAALTSGSGPLSWTFTAPATAAGTATLANGVLEFDAKAGFSGTVTIPFIAKGKDGLQSASADLTITVVPTAGDIAATKSLDMTGNATLTATPTTSGSGTLTYSLTGAPSVGTTSINASTGAITYKAAQGVSGVFSATWKVSDGTSTSEAHSATFTVRPYIGAGDEDTTADHAVDLQPLATSGTPTLTWQLVTAPTLGTADLDPATGAVHYTPFDGVSGPDEIAVRVVDGSSSHVASATVVRSIDVYPTVADVAGQATTSATPVATDIAPSGVGTNLTYSLNSADVAAVASKGTVALVGGMIRFTPKAGFSGTIAVRYSAVDDPGLSTQQPATATLTVLPVGTDASVTVASGGSATTPLPASGTGPFTWTVVTPLPAGVASATVDSHGVLTVVADGDFSGTATIDYTVQDASGTTGEVRHAVVTVTPAVGAVSRSTITAVPASTGTGSGTGTAPTATATPVAAGSGPFTWTIDTAPAASVGAAEIDAATGRLTFTPAPGFSGIVTIPFTGTDANGTPVQQSWTVNVLPRTASSAAAAGGAVSGPAGAPETFAAPTPVGTAPFRYVIVSAPAAATGTTVIDAATGVITFTPARGFSGVASVQYAVIDADGLESSSSTVTFTVAPGADAASLAFTGGSPAAGLLGALLALLVGTTLMLLRRRLRGTAE